MYTEFKGRNCDLYNDFKQVIRRFHVGNDIINVQVSGSGNSAKIAITMKDGKTVLYKATGQIIRN